MENSNINQPSFNEFVSLKRKSFWSLKYLKIQNSILSYYQNRDDKIPRMIIKLKKTKFKQIKFQNKTIIQISSEQLGGSTLKILSKQQKYFQLKNILSYYIQKQKETYSKLIQYQQKSQSCNPNQIPKFYLQTLDKFDQNLHQQVMAIIYKQKNEQIIQIANKLVLYSQLRIQQKQIKKSINYRIFIKEKKQQIFTIVGPIFAYSLILFIILIMTLILYYVINQINLLILSISLIISILAIYLLLLQPIKQQKLKINLVKAVFYSEFSLIQVLFILRNFQQRAIWCYNKRFSYVNKQATVQYKKQIHKFIQVCYKKDDCFFVVEKYDSKIFRIYVLQQQKFNTQQTLIKYYYFTQNANISETSFQSCYNFYLMQIIIHQNRNNPLSQLNIFFRKQKQFQLQNGKSQSVQQQLRQRKRTQSNFQNQQNPYIIQAQKLPIIFLQYLDKKYQKLNNSQNVFQGFQITKDNKVVVKSEGILNIKICQLWNFIQNQDNIYKYNNNFQQSKIIKQISDQVSIVWIKYKGMFPISSRDFVNLVYKKKNDEFYYLISKSIDYNYQVKGTVRANLIIGGFYVEKIDQQRTKLIYLQQSDIGGNIPLMIKKQIGKSQASVVLKIKQYLNV